MPKRVDHEQRRRKVIDALLRITARGGVGAATFRDVAAEAGMSVSNVQYFFGTKDQLLLAALRQLQADVWVPVRKKLSAENEAPSPRVVVATVLEALLPTAKKSRMAMLLFVALHSASLTDPSVTRPEALEVPRALIAFLANEIRRGQGAAGADPALDPDKEAMNLVFIVTGAGQAILGHGLSVADGRRLIDYAIDRICPPGVRPT